MVFDQEENLRKMPVDTLRRYNFAIFLSDTPNPNVL